VRGALRGGLLVAGCATLIALPPLLRPGTPRNETVLPLDYERNLLIVLLAVAAGMLAAAALPPLTRALRTRRGGPRPRPRQEGSAPLDP
jgi:hypothetical protein